MIHFIVNEKSRSGKGTLLWDELKAYLDEEQAAYKYYYTEYEGHATALAREICESVEGEISLVVVGGDGTVNETVNGITDFARVRFAVIPTGSGNDFVRGLGIKDSPLKRLKDIVASTEDEVMDLGIMKVGKDGTEKYFAISAGIGLDALVCKKTIDSKIKKYLNKIHLGSFTYVVLTVQSLFTMKTTKMIARFDDGETRRFDKLIFLAAMNFRAEGGGVPMAPKADVKDGLLSVCLAYGIPKWRTFFCLPLLVVAKHENIKGFEVVNCRKCHIKIKNKMAVHTDGEYIGDHIDVYFECVPQKLRIMA